VTQDRKLLQLKVERSGFSWSPGVAQEGSRVPKLEHMVAGAGFCGTYVARLALRALAVAPRSDRRTLGQTRGRLVPGRRDALDGT